MDVLPCMISPAPATREAVRLPDALVAEAHAEDGELFAEALYGLDGYAGLVGGAGAGGDDDLLQGPWRPVPRSWPRRLRTTLTSAPSSHRYWYRL